MGTQVRTTSQHQLGYVEHTSVTGECWTMTFKGTATGNGAAGGTTIVDTNADSGAAHTYIGNYWVELLSGASQGEWLRCVADDGSGTLTLEGDGAANQITSGVQYRLWKSPEPTLKVTASTSTTQFTCAERTEANDLWIGYEAIVIYASDNGGTSPIRSEMQTISDSTSTGVMTVDTAFSNAPLVGDVLVMRRFVEADPPSLTLDEPFIPRLGRRINFSRGDGITGARGGSASLSIQATTSGVAPIDATYSSLPPTTGLLKASGLVETIGRSNATVNGDSTTTVLETSAGTDADFAIGMMVTVNGEQRFVTAIGDGTGTAGADQITIDRALKVAPASGDLVGAGIMYAKSTTGDNYGVWLEYERDGTRVSLSGCKGSMSLVDGEPMTLNFDFSVDHWIQQIEAAPYNAVSAYTTAPVILSSDRVAVLDSTKVDISGFTATIATEVAPRNTMGSTGVNGRNAFQTINYGDAGGTFRTLLDSSGTLPEQLRWTARTASDLKVVYGSHEDAIGVRVPVAKLISSPASIEDDGGMQAAPNVYGAFDAGTTSNTGDGLPDKIPDWSIHFS